MPTICPECNQSYFFEAQCPSCNGKINEKIEALELSSRISNLISYMGIAGLYDSNIEDIRKLDSLVTKIFIKHKELKNGTNDN